MGMQAEKGFDEMHLLMSNSIVNKVAVKIINVIILPGEQNSIKI